MSSESMVTCASGLLPNPAKVPYFQCKAWWYSIVQKFHNEAKKNSRITILSLFWPTAMIQPKSQNFEIGHDGILSIGNFILMIKNHILIFNCPVTDQQPKNVLPISVVTRNFLFIFRYANCIFQFCKMIYVACKLIFWDCKIQQTRHAKSCFRDCNLLFLHTILLFRHAEMTHPKILSHIFHGRYPWD
jgi:hypothetical protein